MGKYVDAQNERPSYVVSIWKQVKKPVIIGFFGIKSVKIKSTSLVNLFCTTINKIFACIFQSIRWMKVSILDSIDFMIPDGCRVRKKRIGHNIVCHIENNGELFGMGNVGGEAMFGNRVIYYSR